MSTEFDVNGNRVLRDEDADKEIKVTCNGTRYCYDVALAPRGWEQYDTDQDAWYFGVWVHVQERKIMTYAEGDRILMICPDDQHLQDELQRMAEFYGDPPPAFRIINADTGARINIACPRPSVPSSQLA